MKITRNYFKVIICTLIVNLCFTTSLLSQTDSTRTKTKSKFWKKVRFGGGIGIAPGNGIFSATLAPTAIYQFNPNFAMGIGLNGTINNRKNVYKSTILGGSVIALANPIDAIQLSGEFEQLNVNRKFDSAFSNPDQNYWYPALFLGAGVRTRVATIGIRYDVLYDQNKSIYPNAWVPFVRVFF